LRASRDIEGGCVVNATNLDLDPAAAALHDPASAAAEFADERREVLRPGISIRERPQTPTTADTAAEYLHSLIQRVSVSSIEEIERVISELEAKRDAFCTESDRVQRAATNYAGMSQAATLSMQIIADDLLRLKNSIPRINHDPR
jgi:hypothetical protein